MSFSIQTENTDCGKGSNCLTMNRFEMNCFSEIGIKQDQDCVSLACECVTLPLLYLHSVAILVQSVITSTPFTIKLIENFNIRYAF